MCGLKKMCDHSNVDLLSNLPSNIIDCILTRLPIRDAVRTSILSSVWRYEWSKLTLLVFTDECVPSHKDIHEGLVNFVRQTLFLHQGPIHKFHLSSEYLRDCPDLDQWLLFLSRNEIKEIYIELGDDRFVVPSSLFCCKWLTRLELYRCELDLPYSFSEFPNLKSLSLNEVSILPEVAERLISRSPLLKSLTLSYIDCFVLNICSPNLKYLCLEGEFDEIRLGNTPLLIEIFAELYMNEDISEHFEFSSSCNLIEFLGGVPRLKALTGRVNFTKYLSIGNFSGILPIKFNYLKIIHLCQVNFYDTKEILVVLRLVTHSPNLKELQLGGSNAITSSEELDLDFWDVECPSNYKFEKLKVVNMTDLSGLPQEMEFTKFLLCRSPVLETMSIGPCGYGTDGRLNMLIELVRFKRASPQAEIIFC